MKNKQRSWGLILILTLTLFIIGNQFMENLLGENTIVSTENVKNDMVIVGGAPVGIYMDTNGVMVISTDAIESMNGEKNSPAEGVVLEGDYITGIKYEGIEHCKIDTKTQLLSQVAHLTGEEVTLDVRRNNETIQVSIQPVQDRAHKYKLGIWVRDNLQGLGTLTYIDAKNHFGSLGHGIHDIDTNQLLEITEGELYSASIRSIIKGKRGEPGGLEGVIIYNPFYNIGDIDLNHESGVYGTIENIESMKLKGDMEPTASASEIVEGSATIRCTIEDTVEEYDIEILDVNTKEKEVNKGLVIRIVDEKLLELTGGIVQGMSGAPIIQNGKLIGAVTHVMVNDPTRGYGIFIENMLETAESVGN